MEVKNIHSPKVILGVAAHPDDLDFGASGTMAKYAKEGAEIYYLILTDGSKGTEDRDISGTELHKIRISEQENALKAVGGVEAFFLTYTDGELTVDLKLKKDIVRYIRKIKPDTVVTMDPTMVYSAERGFINHPDHRAAGQATLDSVFPLARDHMAFPELLKEGLEPHKVKTLLLVNFDNANFAVDIKSTLDNKIAALRAHQSQIKNREDIADWVKSRSKQAGEAFSLDAAEIFVKIDIA